MVSHMTRLGSLTSPYLTPTKSDGTSPAAQTGANLGKFTLVAGTTYYYILSAGDAPFASVHITGYTAGLVITSATIADCNHTGLEVSDLSTTSGEWLQERPSSASAYVSTTGTGWSVASGVVASAGSAVGGALWHVAETCARRVRLEVVVGGTGGDLRVSYGAKS